MKITDAQVKSAADTIRGLCADMVEKAASGHPGAPLGLADVAADLWLRHLVFDPKDPAWAGRDRLVFSGGHASTLVYSLLHLSGTGKLSLDDLRLFRQFGSRCAGHPERGLTPGVEVTTGPLGQGFAMAVGLALAAKKSGLASRTWVFMGDGDMEEGISHEAASFAGALQLGGLVAIYDSNGIQIEGKVTDTNRDDARCRFEAYGWKVFETDGHDLAAVEKVLRKAEKFADAPVLVIARTVIGCGAPTKAGSAACHGAPLGAEEIAAMKAALGLDPAASFAVRDEVYAAFRERAAKCHRLRNKFLKEHPAAPVAAPERKQLLAALPKFDPEKPVATRIANGAVMNALADACPALLGGSADLEGSNKTGLKAYGWFAPGDFGGRNIHFGVRELGMSAIVNGITAYGGYRGFGATFFVFSDYCRPAIRLAALMELPSIFVFSHDSFYVGEDGPTHEPVEQLAALRAIPNLTTWRPADANETGYAWVEMLMETARPSLIATSRQNLPILAGTSAEGVRHGGYVIFQQGVQDEGTLLFLATGSEVALAVEAAKALASEGRSVRVVSLPSVERFLAEPLEYRDSVAPGHMRKRIVVEAASRFGWDRFRLDYRTTRFVTLDHFGASGPYRQLAGKFGFTVDNVCRVAKSIG